MKMRLLGIIFLICLFFSCDNKTIARFEILNNTDSQIDSLRIIASGNETDSYVSLNPNEKKKYFVDMTEIAKVDGNYKIDYKIELNKNISRNFGYYTNGYPIEKLIKIQIKTDTLLFNSELNRY